MPHLQLLLKVQLELFLLTQLLLQHSTFIRVAINQTWMWTRMKVISWVLKAKMSFFSPFFLIYICNHSTEELKRNYFQLCQSHTHNSNPDDQALNRGIQNPRLPTTQQQTQTYVLYVHAEAHEHACKCRTQVSMSDLFCLTWSIRLSCKHNEMLHHYCTTPSQVSKHEEPGCCLAGENHVLWNEMSYVLTWFLFLAHVISMSSCYLKQRQREAEGKCQLCCQKIIITDI